MGKGFKYVMMAVMMVVLTGCPPHCEYSLIDFGTLSEEAISYSPYVDGQSYSFVHSGGQKITYLASRTREMQTEYLDRCGEISYEMDLTILIPDYPLFPCDVSIQKIDTSIFECYIRAGDSFFWFPTTSWNDVGNTFFDSIQFGDNWYREVYKMGNSWWNTNPEGLIQPDSLFYNTSFGILKILMTNGEFYEICE